MKCHASLEPGHDPRMFRRRAPLADRFWRRVSKSPGCWEWIGCRSDCGYGRLNVGGRPMLAHRLSWILARGSVPDGRIVCHTCDNPACVRPDHLFVGSQSDNMRDMAAKGRHRYARGEDHPRARLSDADVEAIRRIYAAGGISQTALARRFGVSSSHVSHLLRGYGRVACVRETGAPVHAPVVAADVLVGAGA